MRLTSALLLILACGPLAAEPEALRIATWGGAYQAVQQRVLFEPFTAATGIAIEPVPYNGGLAILDGDPPDLVDMSMTEVLAACRADRLTVLDHSQWAPAPDGTAARRDFVAGALHPCAVAHSIYATVIAYDSRAFDGRRPTSVADFFDQDAFPGARALQAAPYGNLEWALMSYGVPRRELYDLLSTPRGLDLAFARLDSLEPPLYWWQDGQQPVDWLRQGKVSMASGYNGRFFDARLAGDSPIEILWDGQLQERQTWVIPATASQPEAARRFIHFATTSERMEAIAERIAYGPTRHSAAAHIGRHPDSGVDMRPHIPTHPYNAAGAIRKDVVWYARTYQRVRGRFERWRAEHDD